MRYRVRPYRQGSASARSLADALPRGRVLRLQGSRFTARGDDLIINWGNTEEYQTNARVLNRPNLIRRASNKLEFFNICQGNTWLPQFWTRREDIPNDAFPVVCRTVLSGHSGEGIVIANNREELVNARLYVKYEKKRDEYRIHIGLVNDDATVIAVQRKARRTTEENPNWQVRNLAGGFVFTRQGFVVPEACVEAAKECLRRTGLDFGAVDVIWNEANQKAFVLEVNTAPGLEGQTVTDYATFFNRY